MAQNVATYAVFAPDLDEKDGTNRRDFCGNGSRAAHAGLARPGETRARSARRCRRGRLPERN
jgi:hypothetical protein